LSIPYQALSQLPRGLQTHVVEVLQHLAIEQTGPRSAAAAYELGVCYSSDFGISISYKSAFNDGEYQDLSMKWILHAAACGGGLQLDSCSRATVFPSLSTKSFSHWPMGKSSGREAPNAA
jgi:hypothetical protein